MVPKVDTFALDIGEEVKRKEATLADIATASNDIGNKGEDTPLPSSKSSRIFFIAIVFLVLSILGFIGFVYYYFLALRTPTVLVPADNTISNTQEKKSATLSSLSPELNKGIGRHVTVVEKKERGYVISFDSYSPVFAYMTRNEDDYIGELVDVLNPQAKLQTAPKAATPPGVLTITTTPTGTSTSTSTPTSTSTNKTSTSTTLVASTSTKNEVAEVRNGFKDVTVSNINMRVYTEPNASVVYAFISNDKLIIGRTPEDILSTKNAILR